MVLLWEASSGQRRVSNHPPPTCSEPGRSPVAPRHGCFLGWLNSSITQRSRGQTHDWVADWHRSIKSTWVNRHSPLELVRMSVPTESPMPRCAMGKGMCGRHVSVWVFRSSREKDSAIWRSGEGKQEHTQVSDPQAFNGSVLISLYRPTQWQLIGQWNAARCPVNFI